MKLTLLSLTALVHTAFAQAPNSTYLTGLSQALNASGLTQLAAVAAGINNTAIGQRLLSVLPTKNWTIFAPNDTAFQAVPSNVTSNLTTLADIISYHVVSGNFSGLTSTFPNVTIGRTLLSDSSFVGLEGNRAQVIAWTNENGTIRVLNQPMNVTVLNTTRYQNLEIYIISGVLEPPGPISTVLARQNLTTLSTILSQLSPSNTSSNSTGGANVTLATVLEGSKGFTLFAPNDAALQAAASTISSLPNMSVEAAVIGNHIINGTTVYSPALSSSSNFTSASGEPLSFTTNSTGTYVMSGSSAARIVSSDVLAKNGVVHVIDGVLANTASDPAAASSAYASATSTAAQTVTETGPVGGPTASQASRVSTSGSITISASRLTRTLCAVAGILAGGMLAI